jgi:predicted MFS family arabinose efflux permease
LVGLAFAVMGVAGAVAAFAFGRVDSNGRERPMLAIPMLVMAGGLATLLAGPNAFLIVLAMAVFGFANGPLDIALFTLRQRRTDPAWMGRAFAVSMSINYAGVPLGSLIAGFAAGQWLELTILLAAGAAAVAAAFAWWLVPASPDESVAAEAAA